MRSLQYFFGVMLLAGCWGESPYERPLGDGGGGAATTTTGEGGDLFTGGGGAASACTGQCVASADGPFVRVTMVSIGTPEEVKPCPDWAPLAFEGYAGMKVAPHTCPSCSCGPAACALPQEMHASAAKCADAESAPAIDWSAPVAWEGVCSAEAPIAAGMSCEGVPCVQSLTLDAPAVEPCKPAVAGVATFPEPAWDLVARECKIEVDIEGEGCGAFESCAPAPPEGFVLCVSVAGEGYECPKDYPRPYVVFDTVDDARACSPCTCSEPEGAECAALVSVFTDGACGALLGSFPLVSDEPGCFDLPSGSALGSKSATLATDKPGTCKPSGGAASGNVTLAGPMTLCCHETEPDPPT